jgi:hypothetical protein
MHYMSVEYRAILLEENTVDSLWRELASADEDAQQDILASVLKNAGEERDIEPLAYAFDELRASWSDFDKEEAMIHIAELDQEFLIDLATMKYVPEHNRGFRANISRFAQTVGIEGIDPHGGGEDSAEWKEFARDIASLRNIVRHCREHGKKLLVFAIGDATEVPYFAQRAKKIYSVLKSSWGQE